MNKLNYQLNFNEEIKNIFDENGDDVLQIIDDDKQINNISISYLLKSIREKAFFSNFDLEKYPQEAQEFLENQEIINKYYIKNQNDKILISCSDFYNPNLDDNLGIKFFCDITIQQVQNLKNDFLIITNIVRELDIQTKKQIQEDIKDIGKENINFIDSDLLKIDNSSELVFIGVNKNNLENIKTYDFSEIFTNEQIKKEQLKFVTMIDTEEIIDEKTKNFYLNYFKNKELKKSFEPNNF